MYDWLDAALDHDNKIVVTANLRLTRTLRQAYGEQQIVAGRTAWKSPQIHVWSHWLGTLYDAADSQQALPTRLGTQQTRVLWERCVRREVDDTVVAVASLAKLARDNWSRMNDWLLDPDTCANAAVGQDQRIFARAVQNYRHELADRRWIDEAMLPEFVATLVRDSDLTLPSQITLSGFDRLTPAIERILELLGTRGVDVVIRESGARQGNSLLRFPTQDAELRSAGQWAAEELGKDPAQKLAVVVIGLDDQTDRAVRLLREGMTPGWQYGNPARAAATNVSYGQALASYPAIHAALLMLRWQFTALHGAEISRLLRSAYFGIGPVFGRTRLEMMLRQWPDREWTQERLLQALHSRDETDDAVDWLSRVAKVRALGDAFDESASPGDWARNIDELLKVWNWPGEHPLNSSDFQLVNRWRDLLNEFAQLELVISGLSLQEAVNRVAAMAADTLFQSESDAAVLSVLGPLEAAGLEFDQLWVTGMAAEDWPPAGRPSALLPRELQRSHRMPDADPQDTTAYAERVLNRLRSSAPNVVLSYAAIAEDRAQLPSALLQDLQEQDGVRDPGWHARELLQRVALQDVADARATLQEGAMISGGARTINLQRSEPFAAFVAGRLELFLLAPFAAGIAPSVRGSLVHDSLFNLYAERPSQAAISGWSDADLELRVNEAIDAAFGRHERYADAVLLGLFRLERKRTAALLLKVVELDRSRDAFSIDTVERAVEGRLGPVAISLRCDRIDTLAGGEVVILDYKTGARKRFLRNGEPDDWQLVVYACVAEHRVSGLGLYNVDSSYLGIDGTGPALAKTPGWESNLQRWKNEVVDAAKGIARGEVFINGEQGAADARPLAILSRIEELRRDG